MENGGSLRQTAAWGAKWTAGSSVAAMAVQLVRVAVLAHLLAPRDFGLAASATVVIGVATAFQDGGLSQAIIAKKTTSRDQLSSLYFANILAGAIVTVLVIAVAPLIADFYHQPDVEPLLILASAGFLVSSVGQQFQVLLQRELEFDVLAKNEIWAGVVGLIVPIALAVAGAGAAAIIAGSLAFNVARSALLVAVGWGRWRPHLHFRLSDLEGYMGFGMYQMGTRAITYLGSNMDYILIGRYLGAHQLGIYSIAFQLIVVPQLRFNPICNKVAFPVFARRQDDDAALSRAFIEVSRVSAMIAFPTMAGLAAVAPAFVDVVYGDVWSASVPIIQILAIVGALFALNGVQGPVFLAKNRPDVMFKLQLFRLPALGVLIYLAAQYSGIVAVAWVYAGVVILLTFIGKALLARVIGLRGATYTLALWRPATATAVMAGGVLLAGVVLDAAGASSAVELAVQVTVGIAAYAGAIALIAREEFRELWSLLVARRAPPPAPVAAGHK
jgi:O-antigen/teichoic acid export membrane protein